MKYKSVKGLLKSDESLIPVTFIDKTYTSVGSAVKRL